MTVKLPEWITKLENSEGYWGDTDSLNVIEALTIALEALDDIVTRTHLSDCYLDPSKCLCYIRKSEEALARINALGEKD